MKYLLNREEVDIRHIECTPQPAGQIQSGFTLTKHELIEIRPPASMLTNGKNTLAFHVPKFPEDQDPYVHIYEFLVDVEPR